MDMSPLVDDTDEEKRRTEKRRRFRERMAKLAARRKAATTNDTPKVDLSKVKCYACQRHGHYARQCPHKRQQQDVDAVAEQEN